VITTIFVRKESAQLLDQIREIKKKKKGV